jgi:hypothetical protein
MSAPLHGSGAAPLARSAYNASRTTRATSSNLFKKHVSAAVGDLNTTSPQATSSTQSAQPAAATSATPTADFRQLFSGAAMAAASSAPAGTASASGAPNSKQTATVKTADSDPTPSANPVDTLTAALQRAGINTNSLAIVPHDDNITYPNSAGWVNHLITVTSGGRSENIDAALMNINPDVAAMDIKRMLQG